MAKTEHEIQVEIFRWAKERESLFPELRWMFAVPNGGKLPYHRNPGSGKTFSPQLNYLKAEGLRPGVADLFLPCPNSTFCGLFIELKRGSNQLSPIQQEFLEDMNAYGYRAVVCRSAEEAEEVILKYLSTDSAVEYSNDLGEDYG